MPLTFYEDTNQISKLVKKSYEFKLPTFGESRTDPSFFEPSATRIANMRKSASSGVALYDYEGDFSKSDIQKQTRTHYVEPARILGVTREELSQIQNMAAHNIDAEIEAAVKDTNDKIAEKQRVLSMAKELSQSSDNSGSEQ